MPQKHLINRQILQLEVNASQDVYAIQHKMSRWVRQELNLAIETLFDRLVSEDVIIRLDTVELDIGNIDIENDNFDGICDTILKQLEEAIHKETQRVYRDQKTRKVSDIEKSERFFDIVKNKKLGENTPINGGSLSSIKSHSTSQPIKRVNQSLRRHYFDIWLHWLEKGTVPSYTMIPEEDWMVSVLETLGLDIDAVQVLAEKLSEKSIVLERLVLQHSIKDLQSITELYTGFSQTTLPVIIDEVKKLVKDFFVRKKRVLSSVSSRTIETKVWKEVFEIVIKKKQKIDSSSLGKEIIQNQIAAGNIDDKLLQRFVSKKKEDIEYTKLYPSLQEIVVDIGIVYNENSFINESIEIERQDEKPLFSLSNKEEDFEEIEEELTSPQYFNNAGMVLLHPFLHSFFKKMKLIKDGEFKDFECRSRAVLLLHFLASGALQPKEYELVLPKFLCAMPVNIPLDHTIILGNKEKEEANGLLQAVIEHWGVLGGTSTNGLQEGFLTRQGKLDKEQRGWRLYIEQKTLDILLDRLPWNISLIKLPWMKELLKVEWR